MSARVTGRNCVWHPYYSSTPHLLSVNIVVGYQIGLGELCSKTVLLCYAPMFSNVLLRIVMLTLCIMLAYNS